MKPFNLEEAKAGKPIVTREGEVMKFLMYVKEAAEGHRVIVLNAGGVPKSYHETGAFYSFSESLADLFMSSEKYPVKDGFVTEDDMVWWHGIDGLIHTRVGDPSHFHNIKEFPNVYSIKKPVCREGWIYEDYYEDYYEEDPVR